MSSVKLFLLLSLIFGILSTSEVIPKDKYEIITPYSKDCPYDPSEVISSFSVEMAMYYSWFASYAYCYDEQITNATCCKGKFILKEMDWELIDHNFQRKNDIKDENNYVIFKSDKYKKILLGFPGTRGGFWQIVDEVLKSGLVDLEDKENPIKVMSYTVQWFDKIKDMVFSEKNINFIRSYPDYQIIMTGHSLGGSTATYALFISEYYPQYNFKNNRKPVIISYGQNRLGNKEFIEYVEPKADIYRVKRRRDFVSHIPFCTASPLSTDPCQKTNDKLVHPGKYYLIDNKQENIYYCLEEHKEQTDENCLDPVDLGDINLYHHTRYFTDDEPLSKRCRKESALGFLMGREKEEEL